jgi:GNAT superfamily N-acetyltransferase
LSVKTISYATRLLRTGGIRVFFAQLKRQIYSRDALFGFEKALLAGSSRVKRQVPFILAQAKSQDIEELVTRAQAESRDSVHELLERKWFYESGFHDCYIARNTDNGEPYGIAWLISPEEAGKDGFTSRLPELKKDEVLLENCYTFEKYRGKGIMPAMVDELCEKALARKFQRLITYIRLDNLASLRVFDKLEFKKFEEISELKFLFRTKRKHSKFVLS